MSCLARHIIFLRGSYPAAGTPSRLTISTSAWGQREPNGDGGFLRPYTRQGYGFLSHHGPCARRYYAAHAVKAKHDLPDEGFRSSEWRLSALEWASTQDVSRSGPQM